ncbi:hypothetical protein PIB30_100803 [Stylosanthes scabra]|uniref:Zinc finger GRF-type domain-containing protein n=1 Tax=Stylosanthes scabra TaxID=79078 RepID=A0ABU6SYK1_9FABA|nr:hypothetical protein [Stylosanthes scabra]
MAMQGRESRSQEGEKGLVGESYSDAAGSGGNGGSTGGASSRKMGRKVLKCDADKGANCKYFVWLDDYVDCFQPNKAGNSRVAADPIERIKERIASIETMLMARDAGGSKFRETVIFLLGVVVHFVAVDWLVHQN